MSDIGGEPMSDPGAPEVSSDRAHQVLDYLARQLVDTPERVTIDADPARNGVKLSLRVASEDMGKVIGRRGRVAQSIRTVVRAAGAAEGVDVLVDIVD
ncbi:MAG: KH domain-containing protein [Actinomycetota bacterium]|nr:KH domain-containing protein [Actinomycetota bacterium]